VLDTLEKQAQFGYENSGPIEAGWSFGRNVYKTDRSVLISIGDNKWK
jgi:hypothetical protein